MSYKVIGLLLLAACAQADAKTVSRPQTTAFIGTTCVAWPRETELSLPTDTVTVLKWHDENKARWKAAHDDCRNKLNREVRRANRARAQS